MVKDYGRAEEIAQDVFVSALRRMRNTDCDLAFKPWLYEIAKNACIDQFRRGRRAELVADDADEGLGESDRGRLATTSPGPDAAVDQKLSLDHLRGAFGGLSDAHHEILVMRELEGLSYREIGERLGMSRASVESTLFRARKRLSEEYEELVSGERCLRVQAIITSTAGRALGARDQRRMARHVSYCQPCRRHAALAGLDIAALTAKPPVRAKIAAILPLPAFLRRRWEVPEGDAVATSPNVTSLAQWSSQMAPAMDPAGMANWAKAAVAAVTVAIAGVGANVASEKLGSDPAPVAQPPVVRDQAEQQRGASGIGSTGAGAGGAATRAEQQAPAGAGEGSSTPLVGGGDPARSPGARSPANSGQPVTGVPLGDGGRTTFRKPSGTNGDAGSGVPSAPAPQPRPSLGDTTNYLLTPPPFLASDRVDERGERRQGSVGATVQDTRSGLLGSLGLPADPAPAAPETQATGLSGASALPGMPADEAAASRSTGGTLTDAVSRTVGSLVAP
jgi:RNA polymerase sigma factor (sigma-70 family)